MQAFVSYSKISFIIFSLLIMAGCASTTNYNSVENLNSSENANPRLIIMPIDVELSILGATGNNKNGDITEQVLNDLIPGINAWIFGLPLNEIELALGGEPYSNSQTKKSCPRARELVGTVLPRAFSFIMGLVTRVVTEVNPYEIQENLSPDVVDCLSTAIRLGYDTPQKLNFAFSNPLILSRVGVHRAYS